MDSFNYTEWCIAQHRETNHWYDKYLPYEFHLRMVDHVAQQFDYLLDAEKDIQTGKSFEELDNVRLGFVSLRMAVRKAIWGHDLIEDCRISFNTCVDHLGKDATEIVYAVTNEKGKNRKERANDKYYDGIVKIPGATFVKLCDRIANVQYGKMTGSGMFDKYKKENENFIKSLGFAADHELFIMFEYLNNLFN